MDLWANCCQRPWDRVILKTFSERIADAKCASLMNPFNSIFTACDAIYHAKLTPMCIDCAALLASIKKPKRFQASPILHRHDIM